MHRKHILKRFRFALISAALAITVSSFWSAGAIEGYTGRRLVIVNEPGDMSKYVQLYRNDKPVQSSGLQWADNGHTGKAVSLTGHGEYIRIGYNQLQMHTMTFSGWFYLRGTADGLKKDTINSQRLFTFSRNDDTWLTVMPHAFNPKVMDKNGKILDGVYMAFSMGSGKEKVHYDFWNPASQGIESYGIPLNEWHHIALTMNGQYLRLYIDGKLWFEKMLILGFEEMKNNSLVVGSGRWGDPTLNALIDDMAIYNFAMSDKQVEMLYVGVDPQSKDASLPSAAEPSLPKAPTAASTGSRKSADSTLLGLPSWTAWMTGSLLILAAALTVIVNVSKPSSSAKDPDGGSKGGKSA